MWACTMWCFQSESTEGETHMRAALRAPTHFRTWPANGGPCATSLWPTLRLLSAGCGRPACRFADLLAACLAPRHPLSLAPAGHPLRHLYRATDPRLLLHVPRSILPHPRFPMFGTSDTNDPGPRRSLPLSSTNPRQKPWRGPSRSTARPSIVAPPAWKRSTKLKERPPGPRAVTR